MADKVLAFPTSLLDNEGRPVGFDSAKIRHRDIWDLAWMAARGAKLVPELVVAKIKDYSVVDYPKLLASAIEQVPQIVKSAEFKAQMTRFIDSSTIAKTLGPLTDLQIRNAKQEGTTAKSTLSLHLVSIQAALHQADNGFGLVALGQHA